MRRAVLSLNAGREEGIGDKVEKLVLYLDFRKKITPESVPAARAEMIKLERRVLCSLLAR